MKTFKNISQENIFIQGIGLIESGKTFKSDKNFVDERIVLFDKKKEKNKL